MAPGAIRSIYPVEILPQKGVHLMTEKKLGRPKGSKNKITIKREAWITEYYADPREVLCPLSSSATTEEVAIHIEKISKDYGCTALMAMERILWVNISPPPINDSSAAKQKKTDNGQLSFNFAPQ